MPGPEIKPKTLEYQDDALTNWATQPGQGFSCSQTWTYSHLLKWYRNPRFVSLPLGKDAGFSHADQPTLFQAARTEESAGRVCTHWQPGNQATTQLETGVLLERGSAVCGMECTVLSAVLRHLLLVLLPPLRLCWLGCCCLLSLFRVSINSACPWTARVLPFSFHSRQLPPVPLNSGFWNNLISWPLVPMFYVRLCLVAS